MTDKDDVAEASLTSAEALTYLAWASRAGNAQRARRCPMGIEQNGFPGRLPKDA
jgi:hypothetical protein